MAINESLLIMAPVLQDYLVDKDTGFPLAAGVVTLYEDTNRSILKNWYYQAGNTSDGYTFIALDNPLTLSSIGTIQDPNGNDVIPFFYPYDESALSTEAQAYYITVYSSDNIPQFTRENFPYVPTSNVIIDINPTLKNYIINNEYWRNIGSLDAEETLCKIIAPSQHDNYDIRDDITTGIVDTDPDSKTKVNGCFSDIRFIKDVAGDADTVEFKSMQGINLIDGIFTNVAPEYYIESRCTNADSEANLKCIQYPISMHISTLKDQPFTVVLWARNEGGSINNFIDLNIYVYTGTGANLNKDPSFLIPLGPNDGRFTIANTSNEFISIVVSDIFPSDDLNLGDTDDDALFLRVQYPVGADGGGEFHISHTKPQLYLGSTIPSNDFDTYDEITAIVNSERTGDIKLTSNNFAPWGYAPMNNGTIGNSDSNARTVANTSCWQLYQHLWYLNFNSQNYAPLYTNSGVGVPYGVTPQSDWSSDYQLTLLRALGQVFAGTTATIDPAQTFTTNFAVNTSALTVSIDAFRYATGTPVQLYNSGGALPTGLSVGVTYYAFYVAPLELALMATPPSVDYVRAPNAAAGSLANVPSVYNNGTLGVGATLTDNSGTFAAFILDGYAGAVDQIFLIKNQAAPAQNGIYTLTTNGDSIAIPWQLTRATFYDNNLEITNRSYLYIGHGTQAGSPWIQTNSVIAIGTDPIAFAPYNITFVTFSSDGTGTHYIQTQISNVGAVVGEKTHLITNADLPNQLGTAASSMVSTSTADVSKYGGVGGVGVSNSLSTGLPINLVQPTTYFNVFVKL